MHLRVGAVPAVCVARKADGTGILKPSVSALSAEEVRQAIAQKRVRKLRDAFRVLVHWPSAGHIEGLSTPVDALVLLRSTAVALMRMHDTRVMPYETMALLQRVADDMGHRLVGGWYATGAGFVLDRLDWWRPRLRVDREPEAAQPALEAC